MEEIIKIVKDGKIKDISDVRDETDLNGLKITIDVRKNSDPDDIMNKLYNLPRMNPPLRVISMC